MSERSPTGCRMVTRLGGIAVTRLGYQPARRVGAEVSTWSPKFSEDHRVRWSLHQGSRSVKLHPDLVEPTPRPSGVFHYQPIARNRLLGTDCGFRQTKLVLLRLVRVVAEAAASFVRVLGSQHHQIVADRGPLRVEGRPPAPMADGQHL